MVGNNEKNHLGIKSVKGELRTWGSILDSGVFPGLQGGPLEHVIAAKAVAFGEALQDDFKEYSKRVISNSNVLSSALMNLGYKVVSDGTDNHLMLLDLRNKNITGQDLESL